MKRICNIMSSLVFFIKAWVWRGAELPGVRFLKKQAKPPSSGVDGVLSVVSSCRQFVHNRSVLGTSFSFKNPYIQNSGRH